MGSQLPPHCDLYIRDLHPRSTHYLIENAHGVVDSVDWAEPDGWADLGGTAKSARLIAMIAGPSFCEAEHMT